MVPIEHWMRHSSPPMGRTHLTAISWSKNFWICTPDQRTWVRWQEPSVGWLFPTPTAPTWDESWLRSAQREWIRRCRNHSLKTREGMGRRSGTAEKSVFVLSAESPWSTASIEHSNSSFPKSRVFHPTNLAPYQSTNVRAQVPRD